MLISIFDRLFPFINFIDKTGEGIFHSFEPGRFVLSNAVQMVYYLWNKGYGFFTLK